ncbi:MAG: 3-hydroxyacyl-ACP dehydratase FabZ family protein [Burkholderia sp.]
MTAARSAEAFDAAREATSALGSTRAPKLDGAAGIAADFSADTASDIGELSLGPEDVTRLLAHRAPFLFVRQASVAADGLAIRAFQRFEPDEPWFAGHFPGAPIVPGVLLIEFVAQAANLLVGHRCGGEARCHLVGVRQARFVHPVLPGQTIEARLAVTAGTAAPRVGAMANFEAVVLRGTERCMSATVSLYLTQ